MHGFRTPLLVPVIQMEPDPETKKLLKRTDAKLPVM